jgi:hypothetical protein
MLMSSDVAGKNISEIEIQSISGFGIWILVKGKEYLLSYEQFPWFKDAKVGQIINVTLSATGNLYWPDLDVDLSVDILEHPVRFPLITK